MKLQIVADELIIDDKTLERIEKKILSLDKYLKDFQEDLKIASLRIQKGARFGFTVYFDMKLPHAHIYSKESDKNLEKAVSSVHDEAEQQIRRYKEKLSKF